MTADGQIRRQRCRLSRPLPAPRSKTSDSVSNNSVTFSGEIPINFASGRTRNGFPSGSTGKGSPLTRARSGAILCGSVSDCPLAFACRSRIQANRSSRLCVRGLIQVIGNVEQIGSSVHSPFSSVFAAVSHNICPTRCPPWLRTESKFLACTAEIDLRLPLSISLQPPHEPHPAQLRRLCPSRIFLLPRRSKAAVFSGRAARPFVCDPSSAPGILAQSQHIPRGFLLRVAGGCVHVGRRHRQFSRTKSRRLRCPLSFGGSKFASNAGSEFGVIDHRGFGFAHAVTALPPAASQRMTNRWRCSGVLSSSAITNLKFLPAYRLMHRAISSSSRLACRRTCMSHPCTASLSIDATAASRCA